MTNRTILFTLEVPADVDPDAFEAFMRDSYLPAVRMSPTRTGQVLGLRFWRGVDDTEAQTTTFVLQVFFGGLSSVQPWIDDADVAAKFESFNTPLQRMGAFTLAGERLESEG
jgi:hypothetical protein